MKPESTETLEQFRERLARVRCQLLKLEPFISFLALELPTFILEEEDPKALVIRTAATDGRSFYYNYKWCSRLSDQELMFTCIHEVAHVMYLHPMREDKRDHRLWNEACDFVINLIIMESEALQGRVCLPSDPEPIVLFDERFRNMTAEQAYDLLKSEGYTPQSEGWDDMIIGSNDEIADAIKAARSATARALARTGDYRSRHGMGNEPGEWERVAKEGLKPTVRWQNMLQRYATSSGQDTHTWSRPNKKLRPHGYYLPSYQGFKLPKTLFIFDTSGSISELFLGQMAAELNRLLQTAPTSSITVGTCDTDLHVLGSFSIGRMFKPKEHSLPGGGGTDFREPFKYAVKNRFEQVIYLTDTEGTFPDKEPSGIDTIWLIPEKGRSSIPFGRSIKIPIPRMKD